MGWLTDDYNEHAQQVGEMSGALVGNLVYRIVWAQMARIAYDTWRLWPAMPPHERRAEDMP